MKPYYEDGAVTIYHGDCREILPVVLTVIPALVLTDPPYGVAERTDRQSKGRSTVRAKANNFPPVVGDAERFDPSHLLRYPRLVLFGANNYADRLPTVSSWIVWDKLDGLTSKREIGFNDNGDAELVWTNLGGPIRLLSERWMGVHRLSEHGESRLHPTQKPVALMSRIIVWRTSPGDLVVDPYMGSGSTLVAAKEAGRKAIGIEIEERYCEIAARRCSQEVLGLSA